MKIETKTAASTNLQGVWPTTLFDNMQVIECLIRAWAGFNRFVDQWTFPRAMREGKSRVGTQSLCTLRNSSSLVSYAAIFVAIFTQYDDTNKRCISEYFLPTSPHVPFNIVSPARLNWTHEWNSGKNEQVHWKKLIAAKQRTYEAELQSYFQM